jgi:Flp pilus assembly protein TadG
MCEPNHLNGRKTVRSIGKRQDRGAALVEMAIILPLLLLILLGMVEFARGYNAKVTLTHATREGVRVLAITGDSATAIAAAEAAVIPLDPNQVSMSTTACVEGEPTSLTASYPFAYSILFFGSGIITIETTAVMRCGG